MTWQLAACLGALGVVATAGLVFLPPLHPGQIWSFVWFAAVGLFSLGLLPYRALGSSTVWLIAAGSAAFILGTLVPKRLLGRPLEKLSESTTVPSHVIVRAATAGCVLTAFTLVCFLVQVASAYGLRSALVTSPEVRTAVQTGETSLTIKYVYIALCAAALAGAAAAVSEPGRARLRWIACALGAVLATYFATGRSTLVVAAVIALVAYALSRPSALSRRELLLGGGGVIVLAVSVLIVGGNVIGKTFESSEISTIRSTFTDRPALSALALPYQYASAPIAGLDVQMDALGSVERTDGCATVEWACTLLSRAGFDAKPYPRIRPFTLPPLKWNTYTALDAPLLDGGPWLVPVVIGAFGFIMGTLWTLASFGAVGGRILYAILTPAVLTSTGSNNFTAPYLVGAAALSVILLVAFSRWSPEAHGGRARPVVWRGHRLRRWRHG